MNTSISSIASNCDFNSHKDGVKQYLWKEWSQLFESSAAAADPQWFERLWELQALDPARHYHTAVHVQELLQYFLLLRSNLIIMSAEEHRAVILAIFFHDAIYNAKSSTNEEDSTELFQSFETNGLVEEMIMASKAHADTDKPTVAFFLDLDLSVLGKTDAAYQQYAFLIRKEYSFVPHETYCEKRANILESFLQQQYIYKTVFFRDMFEERARSNLIREIDLLRRGVIPGME